MSSSLHVQSNLKLFLAQAGRTCAVAAVPTQAGTMPSSSSSIDGEFESPWMAFDSPWNCQGAQDKGARKRPRPAADAPSSADSLSAKRSSSAKVHQSVKHPKTAALNLSHASTGLQALASAAQSRPETHQPNAYESAGADPEHIKARLRDATCNCQGPCHKAVK